MTCVCVLQQSTPSGSLYASDTGAQSPAQYASVDIIADDDKARQASTARIGGGSALLDKVDFYPLILPTFIDDCCSLCLTYLYNRNIKL